MSPPESNTPEPVEWARRVNNHWIVRQGLKEAAEAYLNHLESTDFDRQAYSCRRAHQMVEACEAGQDPKPWFYAGLFSLITAGEAQRFLAGHWFTVACIPSLPENFAAGMAPEAVGSDTQMKLGLIRSAVADLRSEA